MDSRIKPLIRLALALGFSAFLFACSSTQLSVPEDVTLNSLEISYVRSSLIENEFEHFKLQGNLLFVECGTVQRGRYRVESQDVSSLPEESLARLRERAYPLSLALASGSPPAVDEPGSGSSFFDPGRLTITLNVSGKASEMKTSVDAISSPTSQAALLGKKMVETMRAEARAHSRLKSLCGNSEFYGLK